MNKNKIFLKIFGNFVGGKVKFMDSILSYGLIRDHTLENRTISIKNTGEIDAEIIFREITQHKNKDFNDIKKLEIKKYFFQKKNYCSIMTLRRIFNMRKMKYLPHPHFGTI